MITIRVEEVYKLHGTASVSIPMDSPLEEIIIRFAGDLGLRAAFLVDSHQRFLGLITHADLKKWLQLRFFGGKGAMRGISAWEAFRLVSASKAKDLARGDWRSLGIKESDSLETALEKMIEQETNILPVLDSQRHILGDLTLCEVIEKTIEVGRHAGP